MVTHDLPATLNITAELVVTKLVADCFFFGGAIVYSSRIRLSHLGGADDPKHSPAFGHLYPVLILGADGEISIRGRVSSEEYGTGA